MKIVHAEEAMISRAVVQIRMLEVNGRKMTLALFRQIHEESPFDDTREIKGSLWGYVNYSAAGLSGVNVLWQKGDQLRRWTPSYNEYRPYRCDVSVDAYSEYCHMPMTFKGRTDCDQWTVWITGADLDRWYHLTDRDSFTSEACHRAGVADEFSHGYHAAGKVLHSERAIELRNLLALAERRQNDYGSAVQSVSKWQKETIAALEQLYIAG